MPRVLNRLTAAKVETLSKPGRHSDGGNLYLNISKDGNKSWVFIFTRGGKPREMGLGAYSKPRRVNGQENARRSKIGKSLDEARRVASIYREGLSNNIDPFSIRDANKQRIEEAENAEVTFGELIQTYLHERVEYREDPKKGIYSGHSNKKHRYQWRHTLNVYAAPLHDTPVSKVTKQDILKVLLPMWFDKNETAKRTRQRLETVWGYGKSLGYCDGANPAMWKGNLEYDLKEYNPKPVTAEERHLPSMPYEDVPKFVGNLQTRSAPSARLMEFAILTAVRSKEVREAKFEEFNLENKTWTIPALRMKNKETHVVPLTKRSVEIIQHALTYKISDYVFPNPNTLRPYSDNTPRALLKRMGVEDATFHGFRSSFRGFADEKTNASFEVKEKCIAHKVHNKTQAAYSRSDLLKKRRKLHKKWEKFILSEVSIAVAN